MHPRYFVGLTLPDDIYSRINISRKMLDDEPNIMKPLMPHITLLHPGVLTSVSPMYMIPKIKTISQGFMPLKIKLTNVDTFDRRVLYITVESPELISLQKTLVKALPDHIRSSYEFGKKYTPHITIAQAEPKQSLPESLLARLMTDIKSLLPVEFESKDVKIFKQIKPREYSVTSI